MKYTKSLASALTTTLLLCLAVAAAAQPRYVYVDAVNGDDGSSGLSRAAAVATITVGSQRARPGDTVLVAPGTYVRQSPNTDWDEVSVQRSGRAGAYITIRGERDAEGNRAKIVSTQMQALSTYQKSYLIIEGFEITIGETDDQGLVQAFGTPSYRQFFSYPAEEAWNGRVGIAMNSCHNIIARDLYIHDFPGNGVQSGGSDAILVEDVLVEHCGYGAPNANSGISFYQPRDRNAGDVPGYDGYGIVIRDCVSRYNTNLRNFVDWGDGVTDGNGIIIDDFRSSQDDNPVNYPKRTLVLQNVTYGNGGPGINLYESDRVDVYHNSTYDNGQTAAVPGQAYPIIATPREMQLAAVTDVNVVNNVLLSTDDEKEFYSGYEQVDLSFRNNLVFSTEERERDVRFPPGNTFGDPGYASVRPLGRIERTILARTSRPYDNTSPQAQLREPTVNNDFPIQNLRLTEGSPAIDAGEDLGYVTPVIGEGPDIGAHEFDGTSGPRDAPTARELGARLGYDGAAIRIADAPAGARAFVYDVLGRPMYADTVAAAGAYVIDVADFPAGVLHVELRYGGERWTGSVSVVR